MGGQGLVTTLVTCEASASTTQFPAAFEALGSGSLSDFHHQNQQPGMAGGCLELSCHCCGVAFVCMRVWRGAPWPALVLACC